MPAPKETAKLTNRSNARQYAYDIKMFEARKADLQREVDLENNIRKDTFAYQQTLRNLERQSLLDQYEKSEKQYRQQLLFNQQAAEAAVDSQNRVYDQRVGQTQQSLEDLQVQQKRANISTGSQLRDIEFNLEEIALNRKQEQINEEQAKLSLDAAKYVRSQRDIGVTQAELDIQDAKSRKQQVSKSFEQSQEEFEKAKTNVSRQLELKKIADRDKKRSDKEIESTQIELDRAAQRLTELEYYSDRQKDRNQLEYDNSSLAISSQKSELTKAKADLEVRKTALDQQERNAIADRNFLAVANEIQFIQNSGAALATGRVGVSAANSLQSAIASFALDSGKMADSLFRITEQTKNERAAVAAQETLLADTAANITERESIRDRTKTLADKIEDKKKKFGKKTEKLDKKEIKRRGDILKLNREDVENRSQLAQFAVDDAKSNRLISRLSKESAEIDESIAERQIDKAKKAKRQAESSLSIAKTDVKRAGLFKKQATNAKKAADIAEKRQRSSAKQIAESLALDMEIFQSNSKRLGEELVSAATARKVAMKEIARGKVQADIMTDGQRMLPPKFAPDPPRPYKAEMPTLVPPPEPVPVTREAYQVPQPKKQSGLSKVLAIGGAILGVAGAAFTGGASLGLTFGMGATTAAAAATGVGLSAASSGLGLISKYTY